MQRTHTETEHMALMLVVKNVMLITSLLTDNPTVFVCLVTQVVCCSFLSLIVICL